MAKNAGSGDQDERFCAMNPSYSSWTKASLIAEIEMLRDSLHQARAEGMRLYANALKMERKLKAIQGIRRFLNK